MQKVGTRMKHKRTFKTNDYREALEKFRKFKEHGTASVTRDNNAGEYVVELTSETHSVSDMMRQFLVDIKLNHDLCVEELDALDYADSAIKTLVDMGVIK